MESGTAVTTVILRTNTARKRVRPSLDQYSMIRTGQLEGCARRQFARVTGVPGKEGRGPRGRGLLACLSARAALTINRSDPNPHYDYIINIFRHLLDDRNPENTPVAVRTR